jgi:hypothetical protein
MVHMRVGLSRGYVRLSQRVLFGADRGEGLTRAARMAGMSDAAIAKGCGMYVGDVGQVWVWPHL